VTLRGGEHGRRELHAAAGKKKQMVGGGGSGFIREEGGEGLEEAAAWRERRPEELQHLARATCGDGTVARSAGEADEWAAQCRF
jgi:hypothetical protein